MLINCPECRTEYEVPDEFIGQRVQCEICDAKFTVAYPAGDIPESSLAKRTRGKVTPGSVRTRPAVGRKRPAAGSKPTARKKTRMMPLYFAAVTLLVLSVGIAGFVISRNSARRKMAALIPENLPILAACAGEPAQAKTARMYSGTDISGIESIVKDIESSTNGWRKAADDRIDKIRKADIDMWIVNERGLPIKGVGVKIIQSRHAFRFGGVISIWTLFSGKPQQEMYRKAYLAMGFNSAGFNNSLKYKFKRHSSAILPDAIDWLKKHDISVRGHCLIWPGRNHLPHSLARLLKAEDKQGLRNACEDLIKEWAGKWDVSEWDVINETRGNHDIQDLVGHDVICDWFRFARKYAVDKNCKLYLNENRVVSDPRGGIVTGNMKKFRSEVEFLLKNNAPITALGFQSRFSTPISAEIIYKRLCYFNDLNLPITATEFEMKNGALKTEYQKAMMTERVMTVYFSHKLVDGIFAWSLFGAKAGERNIMDHEGHPNLRGKVWLYLMKNRWHTDLNLMTDDFGHVHGRGFKGDYIVEVRMPNGTKTFYRMKLDKNVRLKIILKNTK